MESVHVCLRCSTKQRIHADCASYVCKVLMEISHSHVFSHIFRFVGAIRLIRRSPEIRSESAFCPNPGKGI